MTTLSSSPKMPSLGTIGSHLSDGSPESRDSEASSVRAKQKGLSWSRLRPRAVRYFAILVVLGAWQATGSFIAPVFLSTPTRAIAAFYALMADGTIERAVAASLFILAAGIVCAGFSGIAVGTIMGRTQMLERALDPLVSFGNATPSIALLPLMVIWFGQGKLASVVFIFIIGFWQMVVNTLAGMRVVRIGFRDVGVSFGMTKWEQTFRIYLPATQPFIFAGARIALAQCIVGMILSEQEFGQSGLGDIVNTYGMYFETNKLIAAIGATCMLALALFGSLRVLQRRKFSWIQATSANRRGAR